MAADEKRERVPYFKYAFHNPYNYALLGGFAAAAMATQNWWLAIFGAGAEALWMVFGPDSKFLRRMVFDKMHDAQLKDAEKKALEAKLASLPVQDARRVHLLDQKREEILKLCAENRAFTNELLKEELSKMDQLVESFIDLMVSGHRHEEYL